MKALPAAARRSAAAFFLAVAFASSVGARVRAQQLESATVSTFAGSGAPGYTDGRNGSFVMPTGLAYDASGNLYVSDGGAQRIRRISPRGDITTIAGGGALDLSGTWVPGGYADGTGSVARFNRPAGLAIRRDGSLYVADTFNYCIRRVMPSGTVTTYSGSPGHSGQADGSASAARFVRPVGLAVDNQDNLYVADFSGIRKIDPNGNVTTLRAFGIEPFAVAVFDGPFGRMLFAGDKYGIVSRPGNATDATQDRRFASAHSPLGVMTLGIQGDRMLGNAASLAAIDEKTVVYADPRTNTVRLLETISGETKTVAGRAAEDASGNTGGYENGPGAQAKFFAPMGITRARDGSLMVADAGNRRIRHLSPFLRVDPWNAYGVAYPGIDQGTGNQYRIAYVGNSYIWADTYWKDSIEGTIESRLASGPYWRRHKRQRLRVVPVLQLTLDQVSKFADTAADTGLYNYVVLNLNWGTIQTWFNPGQQPMLDPTSVTLRRQLSASLSQIRAKLIRKQIGFLVVSHPGPFEIDPTESIWYSFAYVPQKDDFIRTDLVPNPDVRVGALLRDAVRDSGAALLDLWPVFSQNERRRVRIPLFGSGDYHFTQYARKLVGNAVAKRLEVAAPWAH